MWTNLFVPLQLIEKHSFHQKKKKNMIKVKAMVSYLDVFCKSEQNEESVKKDKSIACSTTIH